MTKCRVYHGTVTGKDDIFLESFIVTGALSNKTDYPVEQEGGFYASLDASGAAYVYSKTIEKESARDKYCDEGAVRYGRGIMVEIEVELDANNWDYDHEAQADSLRAIKPFQEELSSLACNVNSSKPFFIQKTKNKNEMAICYEDQGAKKEAGLILFDQGEISMDIHENYITYVRALEQIHFALKEKFPERYRQEKQEVFNAMVSTGDGTLKYKGSRPLRVSRIFLRPEDSPEWDALIFKDIKKWEADPLAKWDVVYDAKATGEREFKPASPRQLPAVRRP